MRTVIDLFALVMAAGMVVAVAAGAPIGVPLVLTFLVAISIVAWGIRRWPR